MGVLRAENIDVTVRLKFREIALNRVAEGGHGLNPGDQAAPADRRERAVVSWDSRGPRRRENTLEGGGGPGKSRVGAGSSGTGGGKKRICDAAINRVDCQGLLVLPIVAGLLSMLTARFAVMRALSDMN